MVLRGVCVVSLVLVACSTPRPVANENNVVEAAPSEDGRVVFTACELEGCAVEAIHTEASGRVALVRYVSVDGVSRVVPLDRRQGVLLGPSQALSRAALSPDGRWMAGSADDAPGELLLLNLDGKGRRLAEGEGEVRGLAFGPGGEALAELRHFPATGLFELRVHALVEPEAGAEVIAEVPDSELLGWGEAGILMGHVGGLSIMPMRVGDRRAKVLTLEGPHIAVASVAGTTDVLLVNAAGEVRAWVGGRERSAKDVFGLRYEGGEPIEVSGALEAGVRPRSLALSVTRGGGVEALVVDPEGRRVIRRLITGEP